MASSDCKPADLCNCTQQVRQVWLEPTTRAGASCALCGLPQCGPIEEVAIIEAEHFQLSE